MKNKYIHEMKYHIFRRFPYFFCFFAVVFLSACQEMKGLSWWQKESSVTDVLVCVLKGCNPYEPESDKEFQIPGFYLLMEFMYIVFIAYGGRQERALYGKTILVKYSSREEWWLCKTFWNICSALFFTAAVFAAVFLAVYLTGGGGFSLHQNTWKYMEADGYGGNIKMIYIWCILLRFLILAAVGEFLLCLQTVMTEFFALLVPIAVLAASAYGGPCLGEYLMTLRSAIFSENGYTILSGILWAIGIFSAVYVLGGFLVKKKDIL